MPSLPTRRTRLSGLLLLTATLFAPMAAAAELRNFEDAALHAIQFVDPREGWAVGDDGVIWHTIDRGANWERQPSGVRASLRSLHFLNPYVGWVVGREELANGGSAGVVLFTRDGGLHWRRILANALPGLEQVRFVDPKIGYLVGDGAEQYPSGVFTTTDGGKSWQPVPGPRCPGCGAADFAPGHGGALAGAWNRLATVRRDRVHMVDMDALGGRTLRGLQLRGEGGVAVGQGGLVLLSGSGHGASWAYADLKLPLPVRAAWDFHAVHGVGSHIWAVGRPGSAALHSADGGKNWEVVRTGQTLPLNGLFFGNETHGWAVGELGTILATADGGKTWTAQRRGGQRAAVLFVHARAGTLPLDAVLALGGEDGYLATGLCVTAADPATAALGRSADASRLRQAIRQAGGASGEALWQFPLGSHLAGAARPDILRAWDRLHGDRAADELLRQLVLALRTWRPDAIVTDEGGSGAEGLVAEAVCAAFARAADPTAYPEQLTGLGLAVWKPAKLYGLCSGAATVSLDLTSLRPRLGATVRELAGGPLSLVAGQTVRVPAERTFKLLAANLPGAESQRDLMDGVSLATDGVARRRATPLAEVTPEALRAMQLRTNLRALAEAPATQGKDLVSPERLLAQLGPILGRLPDEQAAPAAYAVACEYARTGQWTLASEAFVMVAERYPADPVALDAYRWLMRYNSSSEARRRHELGQFVVLQHREFNVPVQDKDKGPATPTAAPPAPAPAGPARGPTGHDKKHPKGKTAPAPSRELKAPETSPTEARQSIDLCVAPALRRWYQGALALEDHLAGFGPLFAADPALQFCLQSARRNLGDFDTARKWYTEFATKQPEGPWRDAALAELWLMNRTGPPPKPTLICRPVEKRPYLDGKLDDGCWKTSASVKLRSAAGETHTRYPTEVRIAYDKDYLYLAVRCGHPAGAGTTPATQHKRDGDMRSHDRISVMLDLDRDYSTCFHFQVDARGCVAEDCWGDRSWDPRWFVAVHREPEAWVMEAAIPLITLTGDHVTSGRAWAVNVVRALPGQGTQAFSLPAEVPEEALRLEGMGLLLFMQEARQASAAPAR